VNDPADAPPEATVVAMAAEDAQDTVRQLREDWDSDAPMPLSADYPKTALQRRSMIGWPEPLKTAYLDAFTAHLAAEGVDYKLDAEMRGHVVDRKRR
jgi:hypothetical protein